jgi:hypothetical protein
MQPRGSAAFAEIAFAGLVKRVSRWAMFCCYLYLVRKSSSKAPYITDFGVAIVKRLRRVVRTMWF